MNEEPEHIFVYHTDSKRQLRGCMPLFFCIFAVLVIAGLYMIPIRMPEALDKDNVGRCYYRNDSLVHFTIRQRSPLPFEMPNFVDPSTMDFGRLNIPLMRESSLMQLEPRSVSTEASDSFVLDKESLLQLPLRTEPEAQSEEVSNEEL